jgi:hypothetical protein
MGESFTAPVQNGLPIHWVSPGFKAARAWRKPFSAQVNERVELYLYYPRCAFTSCYRGNFAFFLFLFSAQVESLLQLLKVS